MTRFEALELLCKAYLHEDFDDEYGDPWVAIEDFALSEPRLAPRIVGEITALLATEDSEAGVRARVVGELGCVYLPSADGWTYRGWLQAVADRVDEVLRSHGV